MASVLGFCEKCFRVRYLGRVRVWLPTPTGTCTQCVREEREERTR
jgi:hypothetical protein